MERKGRQRLLTILSLSLFAWGYAQTCLAADPAPDAAAAPAPGHGVQTIQITRRGSQPSRQGAPEYFTGSVRIQPLFQAKDTSRTSGSSVTFEPGARTAWHTHPVGQTLIVTAGIGRVQRWGGPVEEIRPGDVVWIPGGLKHWHGASPTTGMTHISIVEQFEGKSADWLEPVSDTEYRAPVQGQTSAAQPTTAQRLMGDFAPKLRELTDNVLFGDVWARPDLSPRDRSLVTISALIAMNRPDQLRSHLVRARDNGVTQAEVVEVITHLAFYAGWPSAVTAIAVAKDVFQKQ